MFERFTERARRVVVLSQEEARLMNHGYIGGEHLLLGIVKEAETSGGPPLSSLGIELERTRAAIDRIIGRGKTPSHGHIPFTMEAKKALALSLNEAMDLGDFHIEPEHILLALIHKDSKGVGAKVLKELGVDLSEVRSLVSRHLRGRERESVLAETTTGPTKPVTGPKCRGCRSELSKTAAYGPLEIPECEGSETRQVLIVFCSHCGVTQGFLPPI